MKILITPAIFRPDTDANCYLTQNLNDVLKQNDFLCAVSAVKNCGIRRTSLFPCPQPKIPLLRGPAEGSSMEEFLYAKGAGETAYLKADTEHLLAAIDAFQPNLILNLGRPAAAIAARLRHIPLWSVLHPAMFRCRNFPPQCMFGINETLSYYHLEQEFRLYDLLKKADRRIVFGPVSIAPMPEESSLTRIGCQSILPLPAVKSNRLCIFLGERADSAGRLRRILTDAFLGAPYETYVWYRGCPASVEKNMHFLASPRPAMLPGSIACIHDGNDYFFNQCLVLGIPQLILSGADYPRHTNGCIAQKYGFGLLGDPEGLNMNRLYESYRQLTADDAYDIQAEVQARQAISLGDLTRIIDLLHSAA